MPLDNELVHKRFMHQSSIVKKDGLWYLLAIGGKSSNHFWLSSVEALELTPYFLDGVLDKDGATPLKTNWRLWQ